MLSQEFRANFFYFFQFSDLFPGSAPPQNLAEITIEDLMQYGYVELRYIIEWAWKVPGMYDEEALFTTVEPPLYGHTFVQLPLFYDQKIC